MIMRLKTLKKDSEKVFFQAHLSLQHLTKGKFKSYKASHIKSAKRWLLSKNLHKTVKITRLPSFVHLQLHAKT